MYASGCVVGTERFSGIVTANMVLIAFGVVVCALGEVNLVVLGLVQQLVALGFEVRRRQGSHGGAARGWPQVLAGLRGGGQGSAWLLSHWTAVPKQHLLPCRPCG